MYESGVVMLDLADTTAGWPNDSDDAPQPDARCEFLLLILSGVVEPMQRLHAVPPALISMFSVNLW